MDNINYIGLVVLNSNFNFRCWMLCNNFFINSSFCHFHFCEIFKDRLNFTSIPHNIHSRNHVFCFISSLSIFVPSSRLPRTSSICWSIQTDCKKLTISIFIPNLMFFSWINRNYEISAIKVHSWRSLKVKYLAGKFLFLFLSYFELIDSRMNRCFKYQSTNLTITKYILVSSLKIIEMASWKLNLYFLFPRTSMSQNR